MRTSSLPVVFTLPALFAGSALGMPLFSNGSANPAAPALGGSATTASGVAAPVGAMWSELQSDGTGGANAVAGFSSHLTGATGAYRFADDFTVPAGGWRLDEAAIFAYQTGAVDAGSPFAAVNLRIWNGRPGDVGSAVVFGDTTTNRMTSSSLTNLRRVFNSVALPLAAVPDESKPIRETRVNLGGVQLAPGTYWLDWQYTTADASREAFTPAVTIAGARSTPGANARQFKTTPTGGQWADVIDTGKPASAADLSQEFPFILFGAATPACPGDADGDGSIGLSDVALMITNWSFTVAPGTQGDVSGNGTVGLEDLAVVINNWGVSCR